MYVSQFFNRKYLLQDVEYKSSTNYYSFAPNYKESNCIFLEKMPQVHNQVDYCKRTT